MADEAPPAETPLATGGDSSLQTPVPSQAMSAHDYLRKRIEEELTPLRKYPDGGAVYNPQELHDITVQAGKEWMQQHDPKALSEANYNNAAADQMREPDDEPTKALKTAQAHEAEKRAIWYEAEAGRINRGDKTPPVVLDPATIEKLALARVDPLAGAAKERFSTVAYDEKGKELSRRLDATAYMEWHEKKVDEARKAVRAEYNPPPGAVATPFPGGSPGGPLPGAAPPPAGNPAVAPPPAARPMPVPAGPPAGALAPGVVPSSPPPMAQPTPQALGPAQPAVGSSQSDDTPLPTPTPGPITNAPTPLEIPGLEKWKKKTK